MKRLLLAVTILLLATPGAWAKKTTTPAVDTRSASILIDADGTVLHSDRADELRYPASLTKIMTLYLVFEALDNGKLKLNQRLYVSAAAAAQEPSKLGLKPGETVTVETLILGVVTKSANDAAVVLAEGLGRSESEFAMLMTAKAHALGMSNTTFRNASGLPNPAQQTTARDMATLGLAMIKNHPRHYPYFSRTSFTYDGAVMPNHNRMLTNYDGADGIKTGFIRASGFNLVASAVRDGRRLVGVVFGGSTGASRDNQMARLLDNGFGGSSTLLANNSAGSKPASASAANTKGTIRTVVERAAKAVNPISSANAATREEAGSARSGYAIQVGAFARADAAQAAARNAAKVAPQLDVKDIYVDREGGKYYRARIGGLSLADAKGACKVLKDKGQDCLVVSG